MWPKEANQQSSIPEMTSNYDVYKVQEMKKKETSPTNKLRQLLQKSYQFSALKLPRIP